MTDPTEQRFQRWAETRKKGKARFIWRGGLLLSAGYLLILCIGDPRDSTGLKDELLINCPVALLVGFSLALFFWHLSEERYKRFTSQRAGSDGGP